MASQLDTLHVSIGNSAAPHQRPFTCTVSPVVLFSVLDQYMRRDASQDIAVSALLGVRSQDGSEVEIRNVISMLHTGKRENTSIELVEDHFNTTYDLHRKVNPEEVILGWSTTGNALTPTQVPAHTFFAERVAPYSPIHVLFDTEKLLSSDDNGIRAYTSAPVGFSTKPGSCIYLPVSCEIKYLDAERSGLDVLATAKSSKSREAPLLSDMDHIETAVIRLQEMLERISQYVDSVVEGKEKPNNAIGRYIMDTVSVVPKVEAATFEKMFNSHLQDLLMVVYLAKLTRTQLVLSERLQLLASRDQ